MPTDKDKWIDLSVSVVLAAGTILLTGTVVAITLQSLEEARITRQLKAPAPHCRYRVMDPTPLENQCHGWR